MLVDGRAWRSGPWLVDAAARALYRNGEEVPVPPKALSCLIYLVAHHHRALGRDELINAVWGHAHLSDGVLAQTIFQLRGLLAGGVSDGPIRSIRGFGYRWITPVEVCSEAERVLSPPPSGTTAEGPATGPSAAVAEPANARHTGAVADAPAGVPQAPARRLAGATFALGAAALFVLMALASWLLQDQPAHRVIPGTAASDAVVTDGRALLVLPVVAPDGADTTWMRLGLMDLVAARLRAAGATTVPVETALLLDRSGSGEGDRYARWSAATGARVVVTRISHANGVWVVHVEALQGDDADVRVMAESADAVAAAREAADRLALALDHVPAPVPGESTQVLALLQQVDAALLERDLERATRLIAAAAPEVREHPRLRMADAMVAFHGMKLDHARSRFESLVETLDPELDRRLSAQALTTLASVNALLGRPEETRRLLEGLATRLDAAVDTDLLGIVQMNLGLLAQERGDLAEADLHLARARQLLEGVGDLQRQSVLASNLGVHALRSERLAEAGSELDRALAGFEALADRSGRLHVLASKLELELARLDVSAATASAARLQPDGSESLLARTYARTAQAMALLEQGRLREAAAAIDTLHAASAGQPGLTAYEAVEALLRLRWLVATGASAGQRAVQAERARQLLAPHRNLRAFQAEAWHLLVKATLESGDAAVAKDVSGAFLDWAEAVELRGVRLRALMANVAVARQAGDHDAVARDIALAWTLLDDAASPWHWLVVAEGMLPLPASRPDHESQLLRLAQRLAPSASHHFGAACARVRLLDELGPDSARPAAVARARALAGERALPADLVPASRLGPARSGEMASAD
ncbi:winged helix-turn-helix domain-containing protein [Pseudofulvimonas gallinarii]|uniref:DNA-binding winged helix-turn-helix (WHTH) protein n=2 Tax=Pseudofulvimonas gallinarii TaxID=634155 RepID=A0A4S3L0F2_9GAMM|nr:winged helix-turn-helix domain-containing protein [Pseudofulvimonas gallinarii]TCT01294.1 DNA-binding winged helix-turn-helix (wHTH) protein [Pseudofulvimonas gallinarii]THD15056.1 hypothetical protein B1808_01250 [Pseudofulvimonas gallinarii]